MDLKAKDKKEISQCSIQASVFWIIIRTERIDNICYNPLRKCHHPWCPSMAGFTWTLRSSNLRKNKIQIIITTNKYKMSKFRDEKMHIVYWVRVKNRLLSKKSFKSNGKVVIHMKDHMCNEYDLNLVWMAMWILMSWWRKLLAIISAFSSKFDQICRKHSWLYILHWIP